MRRLLSLPSYNFHLEEVSTLTLPEIIMVSWNIPPLWSKTISSTGSNLAEHLWQSVPALFEVTGHLAVTALRSNAPHAVRQSPTVGRGNPTNRAHQTPGFSKEKHVLCENRSFSCLFSGGIRGYSESSPHTITRRRGARHLWFRRSRRHLVRALVG